MKNNELASKDHKSTKTRLSKAYTSDFIHGIKNTGLGLIPNDKYCFSAEAEHQRIGRNTEILEAAKRFGMKTSEIRLFGKKKGPRLVIETEEGKIELFNSSYTELDFNTHREINSNIRYLFKGKKVFKIDLNEYSMGKVYSAKRVNV